MIDLVLVILVSQHLREWLRDFQGSRQVQQLHWKEAVGVLQKAVIDTQAYVAQIER